MEYERGKADMTYASSLSGSITSKDIGTAVFYRLLSSILMFQQGKMRLMRKDELVLVTPKMKGTRSPRVFQKEPLRFSFSGTSNRKVISAVAESTGDSPFRTNLILWSFRNPSPDGETRPPLHNSNFNRWEDPLRARAPRLPPVSLRTERRSA